MVSNANSNNHSPGNAISTWSWQKCIWAPPLLPKIKIFLWKCARNALPTRDNLQRRNITTNTSCLRCGESETLLHLLFHCPFAAEVWSLTPWSAPFDPQASVSFKENLAASSLRINLPPVGIVSNIFPWIVWCIWISRNQLFFEKKSSSPQEVLNRAITACKEWEGAQTNLHKSSPPKPLYPPHRKPHRILQCATQMLPGNRIIKLLALHGSSPITEGLKSPEDLVSAITSHHLSSRKP
ncbi:Uncharacterized protein Rs2_45973 [Raphanus sativus]|nr:Uncharacterized protein Rs2_45973 [Raphanus sativus]